MKKGKTIARLAAIALTATATGTVITPVAIYAETLAPKTALLNTVSLFIDGKTTKVVAYNIDGNNYFRVADICSALDMNVLGYAIRIGDGPKDFAEGVNIISTQPFQGTVEVPPTQPTLNVTVRDIWLYYDDGGGSHEAASSFNFEDRNYVKFADIVNAAHNNYIASMRTARERALDGVGTAISDSDASVNLETSYNDATKTIMIKKTLTRFQDVSNANLSPSQLTEEAVYHHLIALKDTYPDGMPWTNDNQYLNGFGCVAFAYILRDAAFGDAPSYDHTDFNHIRVGDIIRMNNDTHSVVVLQVDNEKVTVAEGNFNAQIHWGREISLDTIKSTGDYISTSYPE